MSKTIEYDFQTPKYTSPVGKFIKLDTVNNQIEINDPTVPKQILINTTEISNGVQNINFVNLYEKLDAIKATVYPAPSTTQLQVENSIIVSDTPASKSVVIDATNPQIQLSDGTYTPYITITSNRLNISGNSTGVDVDSNSSTCRIGDVSFSNNGTLFQLDDPNNNIDLQTKNFTTQGDTYTFPICFSSKSSGNVNYSSPSNWQQVFHYSIPFPAFAIDSTSIYNIWKIEFHMNTTNMTDQTNKECAMYFEIEDASSAIYTGSLFNNTTPFTTHRNGSTYSATSQQSENYGWTDYFDFTGMNGNSPLEFRWYWFANGTNSYDFNSLVSFTRTNLI